EEFLPAVVSHIAQALDASMVFIGEFTGDGLVPTVAVNRGGAPAADFQFRLHGTPCEQLANVPQLCYPMDAAQLFPSDERLSACEAQGYAGALLIGMRDERVGIIAAITPDPIDDEPYATSLLQLFA